MGYMKEKHEFPCGYVYESHIEWGLLAAGKVHTELSICPMHGDKCKSEAE